MAKAPAPKNDKTKPAAARPAIAKPSTARQTRNRDLRGGIVAAAFELYGRDGIKRVRASQIAARAGVDPPLVAYYFPDDESLFLEVIHLVLEDLKSSSARWASEDSASRVVALRKYILGTFDWAEKNPRLFSLWSYFYHLASYSPPFRELNTRIREAGRERIAGMIYKGIVQGDFRAPRHGTVEELAREIQGLLTGQVILRNTEAGNAFRTIEKSTVRTVFEWLGVRDD